MGRTLDQKARFADTVRRMLVSELDATACAELVSSGKASPTELVDLAIERIEKHNQELGAVIVSLYDEAREAAKNPPHGPFRGVPILIKDILATVKGDVHDMLMGAQASEVVHTGQYGVGYIPSSNELGDIHERFKGPMTLTRMLAESGISGIVIIDTRPDLNILTQNALYAADRVLIPVKDMPSLENCRNIFSLFEQRGIDKKSLALIPCLVLFDPVDRRRVGVESVEA